MFRFSWLNWVKHVFLWHRHSRCTKSEISMVFLLGLLTPEVPLAGQVVSSSDAKSIYLSQKLQGTIGFHHVCLVVLNGCVCRHESIWNGNGHAIDEKPLALGNINMHHKAKWTMQKPFKPTRPAQLPPRGPRFLWRWPLHSAGRSLAGSWLHHRAAGCGWLPHFPWSINGNGK